jgi:hypothetical protein
MMRTVISMPEELHLRVKALAAERGISMAAFIREAVEEKALEKRPRPHLGIFESGYTDTAEKASEGRIRPSRRFERIMGRDEPSVDRKPRPKNSTGVDN